VVERSDTTGHGRTDFNDPGGVAACVDAATLSGVGFMTTPATGGVAALNHRLMAFKPPA